MGICRDSSGKLAYTATCKNKSGVHVFSVHKGENKILSHRPYYSTGAGILYPRAGFPWELPDFDSFVQAVRFLKLNIDSLV